MLLRDEVEEAFGHRPIPAEVVLPEAFLQFDSDVEEALWFTGRDWRDVRWQDWREQMCAVRQFSPEAFAYYLPSLLLVSVPPEAEWLYGVDSLLMELDRSPGTDGWYEEFTRRFAGLSPAEFDVLKKWLLEMSGHPAYGPIGKGAGDSFGRAYDTVHLLQSEFAKG